MEIPEGWGGYQRTSGIEEWKFQEGGGFKLKSQLLGGGGGEWIFSGTTHYI